MTISVSVHMLFILITLWKPICTRNDPNGDFFCAMRLCGYAFLWFLCQFPRIKMTAIKQHLATLSPRIGHWEFLVIKAAENLLSNAGRQARQEGDSSILLAGMVGLHIQSILLHKSTSPSWCWTWRYHISHHVWQANSDAACSAACLFRNRHSLPEPGRKTLVGTLWKHDKESTHTTSNTKYYKIIMKPYNYYIRVILSHWYSIQKLQPRTGRA